MCYPVSQIVKEDGSLHCKYYKVTIIAWYFAAVSTIGISFNVRFFALNLLISAFHKSWKCTPDDTQRLILGFLEDTLKNPISVSCYCFLFNIGNLC